MTATAKEWEIVHGDCLDVLPTLPRDAVIVSDPPYGMGWNINGKRFRGGHRNRPNGKDDGRNDWSPIVADDKSFDPAPWLDFAKVVLWGANHFASRLPVGTTLVWLKRNEAVFGKFLSDAEIAWQRGGHGVYLHKDLSMNVVNAVKGRRVHPTQKPVGLMRWCIGRLRLPPNSLIVDPYCGSGSTGVAAIELGHRFLGVELDAAYCDIARVRIAAAQPPLFAEVS